MKEELDKIYKSACKIFKGVYNIESPDNVAIELGGTIMVSNTEYYCGDSDTTTLYLELEELLNPEETVLKIKERKKQEEEERRIAAEKQKKIDEERTLKWEKEQYKKLKKKFEK